MSLQGTFDTLPVTELLGLLSTAGKSGALRLEAGGHEAEVFLSGGRCCAIEADDASSAVAGGDGLNARLVDVGFSLGRIPAGSFRFSDGAPPAHDADATAPIEPAIVEIQALLDQWHDIEATIPSLDVRVRLAPVLGAEEIVLRAPEWSILVDLEAMPTVRDLVRRRPEPLIEVCRILKELVERGAAEVGSDLGPPQPRLARRTRDSAGATVTNVLEPEAPYAPPAEPTALAASRSGDGGETNAATDAAEHALADVAAAVGENRPDGGAVAAGLAARGARSRRTVPDVFAADEPQTTATDAPGEADESGESAPDRGALLRLFSALKEN